MIRQENQLQIHLIFATKRGQFYHTDAAQPASRRRLYTFVATFVGGFVGGFVAAAYSVDLHGCTLQCRCAIRIRVSGRRCASRTSTVSRSCASVHPATAANSATSVTTHAPFTANRAPQTPQLDLRGPTSKGGRVTFQVSRSNKPEVEIRRKR